MSLDPKFLVLRYAPGSAGKFLLSTLMSLPQVAHFDPKTQANKTAEHCLQYIKQGFTHNLGDWIKTEPNPMRSWNLHFISTKYQRGDQLTAEEFRNLANAHGSDHYHRCREAGLYIPLVWHKLSVPEFLQHAKFVTVYIDPRQLKWYHRAYWYKTYGYANGHVHMKIHDPDYVSWSSQSYIFAFQNPKFVPANFFDFVRKNVIDYPVKKLFSDTTNFANVAQQHVVSLSEILDPELCWQNLDHIAQAFDLGSLDKELFDLSYQHWKSCHNFKYA